MVAPHDEHPHHPGPEPSWQESWYFDWVDGDGRTGGYVRLGLLPNLGVAWYWGCLVGEGRPLVTVLDHEVPLPKGRSLAVRTEGLWADHVVEVPLDHVTLGCEAFATGLDDPAEVYGRMHGDRVPFGLDLEWETDGAPVGDQGGGRYEVPCRVHGEVLVGAERLEVDGWGQRVHAWGVQDWWSHRWEWIAGRLDDGTRVDASWALDVEPVADAPVRLRAPDGRESRLTRALCRIGEPATGRRGHGWAEWNEPQLA